MNNPISSVFLGSFCCEVRKKVESIVASPVSLDLGCFSFLVVRQYYLISEVKNRVVRFYWTGKGCQKKQILRVFSHHSLEECWWSYIILYTSKTRWALYCKNRRNQGGDGVLFENDVKTQCRAPFVQNGMKIIF